MPDRRNHRGPAPEDSRLFAADQHPRLRAGVHDLAWLLTRGYAPVSSLAIVGNRYALCSRQRLAVARAACSDAQRQHRAERLVPASGMRGKALWLDGFNVLTTLEAAFAGAVVFRCRDGCLRDIASVHGTYRIVAETEPALLAIAAETQRLGISECRWFFDAPVSNSGRLGTHLLGLAAREGLPWNVELVPDPDPVLAAALETIATADSAILDHECRRFDLCSSVLESRADVRWLDLSA